MKNIQQLRNGVTILLLVCIAGVTVRSTRAQELSPEENQRRFLTELATPGAVGSDQADILNEFARVMRDAASVVPEYHQEKRSCWERFANFTECLAAQRADFTCVPPEVLDCNAALPREARRGVATDMKYARMFRKAAARAGDVNSVAAVCLNATAAYHECRFSALGPSDPNLCEPPGADLCPTVTPSPGEEADPISEP
jgi:hypothetical protein